jgi:hypothetical protein
MGMVCYLRQISRSEVAEIDANPDRAYELILGQKIEADTHDKLLRRADEAKRLVAALHERHAITIDRVREANTSGERISEELLREYKKYLAEFQSLTTPWSSRKKASESDRTEKAGTELRIDKSWHGLHFLLTGRLEGGNPPLSMALMGGKQIPDQHNVMGFGPALKLTAEEVSHVSESLDALSCDELLNRYDPKEMQEQGVYAMGQSTDDDREYLRFHYEKLVAFYSDARAANNGMLVYLR